MGWGWVGMEWGVSGCGRVSLKAFSPLLLTSGWVWGGVGMGVSVCGRMDCEVGYEGMCGMVGWGVGWAGGVGRGVGCSVGVHLSGTVHLLSTVLYCTAAVCGGGGGGGGGGGSTQSAVFSSHNQYSNSVRWPAGYL